MVDRVRPKFFDQVGHETMWNKHFFIKSCHRQIYQNYEQPPGTSQNSYFKSHFSVLKVCQQKNSLKNILLRDQILLKKCF